MPAQTTDLFKKVGASTVTTLSAPGKALGATSLTVGSTTNFPSDTGIIVAIRVVDTSGNLVAGTYTEWSATVTSGTSLAINAVPVYGSDQIYAAGSTTQVFIPLSSYATNKMVDGILEEHKQSGAHSAITADSVDSAGVVSASAVVIDDGGTIEVDTINEATAAAGVTIDSFAIKDGVPKNWNGWITPDETWTYASASTFTVPGDQTAKYSKGTRLKWTQTTVKYGVVVSSSYSSPNTTVTIFVNTDYTIANAVITENYYSYMANPQGYPGIFNFTPIWTNLTVGAGGTNTGICSITGKTVEVKTYFKFGTGSAVGAAILTLPFGRATGYTTGTVVPIGTAGMFDNGVDAYLGHVGAGGNIYKYTVSTTNVTAATNINTTVPFTWTTNDDLTTNCVYLTD